MNEDNKTYDVKDGGGSGMSIDKAQNSGKTLKRLVQALKPQSWQLAIAFFFAIAGVLLNLWAPQIFADAINVVFAGIIGDNINMGALGDDLMIYRDDDSMIRYNLDENGNPTHFSDRFESTWEIRVNTTPLCGPYTVLDDYYGVYGEQDPVAVSIVNHQILQGRDELAQEITSYPVVLLSGEEQTVTSRLVPTLKNIMNQYVIGWVLDGGVDDTWAQYIVDMENAGSDQVLEVFQAVYDRYLSHVK